MQVRAKQDVRLPGIAPGSTPWEGAVLLLHHKRLHPCGAALRLSSVQQIPWCSGITSV